MPRRRISRALLALLLLTVAVQARATGLVDPRLHFRQLRTSHFVIYFHAGEEPMAARLAALVEDVRAQVGAALGLTPPPLTYVVLADQTEAANGWATPLPRDIVFLNAAVPSGAETIGRSSDWLRLVFTHEYTHIVHLDRSRGWARVVRAVFGRTGLAFPNLWLPDWQIEGLATWQESTITGEGRLHAGEFRAIASVPATAGRPLPLDQANGGLVGWPGGQAVYSAGLGFHEYLANRFGGASFGALADATAGRVPYTASPVFRRLFGASIGTLWSDYTRQLSLSADPASRSAGASSRRPPSVRLTRRGNLVAGPRFAPPSCGGCPAEIIYSSRTPHDFPSLRTIHVDGSGDHQLAQRYLGETSGVAAHAVVFDQQEIRRNVGVYSDLYLFDRDSGRVRALTQELRIEDPDLAPDGVSLVAVRESGGRRELVTARLPMQTGADTTIVQFDTLLGAEGTQFSTPRWSPDGRFVAAERRQTGSLPDIVVVDVATKTVRREIADQTARIVTPAWRPDGQAIVAAADFGEHNWELYEFALAGDGSARQLTFGTGALWPDISSDGRTLAFAGYTVDGYDLFMQPYPDASVVTAAVTLHPRDAVREDADVAVLPPSKRYSPLDTVAPTTWSPLMSADSTQVRIGAAVVASDLLGRHAYAADVTWLAAKPSDLVGGEPAGPDWDVVYSYNRWRPSLFVSASRQTTFVGALDLTGQRVDLALAQRDTQAGVFVPFIHVRHTEQFFASAVRTEDRYSLLGAPSPALFATRLGVAESTAKLFGYSISPERGVTAGATTEFSRRTLGSLGDATTSTIDVRAYIPGAGRHHVIAVRAAGGLADGDDSARQRFTLGGSHASSTVIDFGSGALGLLRGFPQGAFWGDRMAVANVEYRFPFATIERGHGTLPVFLRTIYASVFSDAGRTWDRDRATSTWKNALGGELSANVVAGYALPISATIGAAWGRDESTSRGLTVYARLGRAF